MDYLQLISYVQNHFLRLYFCILLDDDNYYYRLILEKNKIIFKNEIYLQKRNLFP